MTTHTTTTRNTTPSHQAEGLNIAQSEFLSYVYTLQTFKTRLKGIDENSGVHINQKEIETRFFKYPTYNRKNQIKYLVEIGALKHWQETSPTTQHKMDIYFALRACTLRPDLLQFDVPEFGEVQKYILKNLCSVSLVPGTPVNDYFECFLTNKNKFPYLFIKFDSFSRRLHTPVTSFPSIHRPNILLNSRKTASVDVATMQPLLLGLILENAIGDNQFSRWINEGKDVYLIFKDAINLENRHQGKDKFMKLIFAPPSDELYSFFGNQKWIRWINNYKKLDEPLKPLKYRNKNYNNLAWLLQRYEVNLMKKVWSTLFSSNIPFLTVHDEVIVEKENLSRLVAIVHSIFEPKFTFYKLNTK